jgi:hypothetical protein
MRKHIDQLARVGSQPIEAKPPGIEQLVLAFGSADADSLVQLLEVKNGFYAFEGALHVFSTKRGGQEHDIFQWNSTELWRNEYETLTEGFRFFAEDVFGNQFCLYRGHVSIFDPETGGLEPFADSMEEWAEKILDDYSLWTGHQLAHDWQKLHGAIPIGSRLLPKIPFVMGGDYVVANLYALEAAEGMRFRACIARQLLNVPDGTPVKLVVTK